MPPPPSLKRGIKDTNKNKINEPGAVTGQQRGQEGGGAVTMTGRALIALNGRRQTHFTLVFGVLRGKVGGVNHSCFLRHGHARQQTGTVTQGAASRALLSTPLLSFVLS